MLLYWSSRWYIPAIREKRLIINSNTVVTVCSLYAYPLETPHRLLHCIHRQLDSSMQPGPTMLILVKDDLRMPSSTILEEVIDLAAVQLKRNNFQYTFFSSDTRNWISDP